MGNKDHPAISRREFARRAAFVSAAASLTPTNLLAAESVASPVPVPLPQSSNAPNLSPESQAEVASRIQGILSQYGSRLSDAQKADIRRLVIEAQPALDRLRAFATENGDGSGLYLKPLVEREKKPTPRPEITKPAVAPKNS
jgi:hypothetical protein